MNRQEIITNFRVQNPDIDDRSVTDVQLNSFLLQGDKEVSAKTKCIVGDYTFTCISGAQYWDISSLIPKFMAIDDMPGGGVVYNTTKPLVLTTIAQLDQESQSWRNRSAGEPESYWMRGKYLWVDRPISGAKSIQIYYCAISDDFNNDSLTPFNGLLHLEPYHGIMIHYLTYRTKAKNKPEESLTAKSIYEDEIKTMAKEIKAAKYGAIYYEPK